MNSSTREGEEFSADNLDKTDNNNVGLSASKQADSASSAWLRSKDPRIVRVSRAFGGKDRHSKVCTIRGLRDRRVRLSVPTAIQLYDLQDRLGLNQPSKVVDWLLNVAKDDIDELPPLQIPPGFNFLDQAHQAMLSSSSARAANQSVGANELGSKINSAGWGDEDAPIDLQKSSFWRTSSQPRSTKVKQLGTKEVVMNEKEMWGRGMSDDQKLETLELGHGVGGGGSGIMQVGSSSNFFPRTNNSNSLLNFLQSVSPYGPYYHFDYPPNSEDHHQHNNNYNIAPLPSGPHVLVCPPAIAPTSSQSYNFPSHHVAPPTTVAPMELDPRQFINHFQILSPAQQHNMSLDDSNRSKR